jgi:hypothetical protein
VAGKQHDANESEITCAKSGIRTIKREERRKANARGGWESKGVTARECKGGKARAEKQARRSKAGKQEWESKSGKASAEKQERE